MAEGDIKKIRNEELLMLFQGAASLKRLHSEPGGLEQHRRFAEQQLEKYRAEILSRMQREDHIDRTVIKE